MLQEPSIIINGWTILAHPLFVDEINYLINKVKTLKTKDPIHYVKKNASKRLAAISKLAFDVIPENPTNRVYRQGSSLGDDRKHWFRAKFFQQYHLFFRFDSVSKIIIYVWVNDENNKRAYGSKTDVYKVFEKLLNSGNPPDSWNKLLIHSKGDLDRFNELGKQLTK